MKTQIDVAVLGLGNMGKTHVGAAKESPYVNRIYGYEPDETFRKSRSAELDVIPESLENIIGNPAIRLVYIASPNEAHVPQAIMALRAGKAVLCEKPMGMSLEEAEKLIAVQEETKGFLQIGFELHYSNMYTQVKQWIDEGLIGTPVNIQCRYYCCEFHKKNSWRSLHSGSFLIGEKLSHYLDLQRWWFDQPAKSVYSASAPKVVPYFNHRDNHQIITKYNDGGIATLNFIMYIAESFHDDPLQEMIAKQSDDGHFLQYHICGTRGAIETDVFRRRIRRWEFNDGAEQLESKIVETITFDPKEDLQWFHNTHGQNVRVAELVARGLPSEVPARDAYESMKICFAAEQSESEDRIIML
ncbi:MAG: Gfo/Idh/MocA family oxidoreductase [Victivallaceae bacterium]|nr:Gfo/Idh/MocA family oxidoreductase [Victivallaceae bacterium]